MSETTKCYCECGIKVQALVEDRERLLARVSDLEAELQEARDERNGTERDNWAEAANTVAAYRELLARRAVLDWHHRERPQNGCPPKCAELFGPDSYATARDRATTTAATEP